jgi:hypothetical protein
MGLREHGTESSASVKDGEQLLKKTSASRSSSVGLLVG